MIDEPNAEAAEQIPVPEPVTEPEPVNQEAPADPAPADEAPVEAEAEAEADPATALEHPAVSVITNIVNRMDELAHTPRTMIDWVKAELEALKKLY